MPRKLPYTPNSKIRAALRQLFLRSREHSAALKAANYTCRCGAKQSRAKGKEVYVEVHHLRRPNWEKLFELIRLELICPADLLQVLCKRCHQAEHDEAKGKTHGHEPTGDVPGRSDAV